MTVPDTIAPIKIFKARAHNLQDVDLAIPHNCLVVVTGVSGSGKSSLAFDTVCREGQRRYLESFSTRARQQLGKLGQSDVQRIDNLSPAIAVDQKTAVRNPRSTVGTMSEIYDHLRLLFARLGTSPDKTRLQRGDFSFNGAGACEVCRGLGVQDAIDPELLVAEPEKTLREGALVITTDSGYIIYSQVTIDVLNQVCQAHGFDVDIPWQDLTDDQKQVILYGSDRIEIPFGKHTLESRMKWSGITARPRQTGFYGGIIPVMQQILNRDRNKNILRFVRTGPCQACDGTRLNQRARQVVFADRTIAEFAALTIDELHAFFDSKDSVSTEADVGQIVGDEILRRTTLLRDLGLGYLTLDRPSPSLSGGEAQRIRLACIVGSGLRGMIYVLDEPSIGLHPRDQHRLLHIMRRLVNQGNSVIVVEHDPATMLAADWLIDIGPGAGQDGGQVLFAGPPGDLLAETDDPRLLSSQTRAYLRGDAAMPTPTPRVQSAQTFTVSDARLHNLQHLSVDFQLQAFNVVSGVSGAGKSSLLSELVSAAETAKTAGDKTIRKLITLDQAPIGRTPRSNAATYTGLFDHIRALYAAQPEAKAKGLGKGQFSFNNKGGRCVECEGAGVQRLGMHFLGDVEVPCPVCDGRRFGREILSVTYNGLDISQVLALPLSDAAAFFADQPKLAAYLDVLVELGLGYLSLGQPSTTLSGGEAQRVKLAAELSRPQTQGTLYILDEPTTGLHTADMSVLLQALDRLVVAGGTVVVSEHSDKFIRFADRVIDLGPDSGRDGGRLVYAGSPAGLLECTASATGRALADGPTLAGLKSTEAIVTADQPIELLGVCTHNLQNLDVRIPTGKITVMTGVSGSGKSSLAIDTLFAEGRSRYAENFSTYIRQQLVGRARADLAGSRGLTPTVAIGQAGPTTNPRSTVATAVQIHPLLRLLFSRTGQGFADEGSPPASFFSFNQATGACETCRGLGQVTICDPDKLVTDPQKSLLDGALDGHKTGRFYGEPDGQFVATLTQVGVELGLDFSGPWRDLSQDVQHVAMYGTGPRNYQVTWNFKRGKNQGQHEFHGTWPGFCGLVNEEYDRKHADQRGQNMRPVMSETSCPNCQGRRLKADVLAVTCAGFSIADLCARSVDEALTFCTSDTSPELATVPQLRQELTERLTTLQNVGLGYITLDRATPTLSGGEYRRLRLAQQLGATLRGLTCVLDEPTLGLHPQDTQRLWSMLEALRDQGNTLVLVEHDPDVILAADHVIDLGPGAGRHGGQIVAQGTPQTLLEAEASVTGRCLRHLSDASEPKPMVQESQIPSLIIHGARANNLKNVRVEIPTGWITALVGVSGSGKSSLLFGTLAATADNGRPINCDRIDGLDQFQTVISIGANLALSGSTGNPATASGVAGPIRSLLAGSPSAKTQGLAGRHFSTAGRGGRCETCQGSGQLQVSLDFLADVVTPCRDCRGQGFTPEVLVCTWQEKNIAQILALTVSEALTFFATQKKITRRLQLLHDIGLAYLTLGQPTRTLSGGERQRLSLACQLLPGAKGPNLYLCDEPTAGLHMADVHILGQLLRRLTEAGHTVIVTEHNQQLISLADRVIELGPGAGPNGGQVKVL